MNEEQLNKGASWYTRSTNLLDNDPLEEIFALNLGDFLTEHLISEDLAQKIEHKVHDREANLKNQLKELISIYSINNTLNVLGFDNKEDYIIYNSIAKTIMQMLDVSACHIFLEKSKAKAFDNQSDDFVLVGTSIDFEDNVYNHEFGYSLSNNDIVTFAIKNKKMMMIDTNSELDYERNEKLNQHKVKVCYIVPMHNNIDTVGLILIENIENKKMNDSYIDLIESTAKLFSTSLTLQELTEETQQVIDKNDTQTSELHHLRAELTVTIGDLGCDQQNFVEKLARMVDIKGCYQGKHSQEVANLSKELSTYLELNEKTKDLIYYAGLLQNIGKITLPQELFNKKDELSKEEWEKLQNHPNIGVNLLMNINFMSEVIPYIHHHKERWDGKGVPEGLKGRSIPFGSRIVAVADAYCAMTMERPYREAMSNEKALEIIKSEAGIKWDPVVVDALVSIKS